MGSKIEWAIPKEDIDEQGWLYLTQSSISGE